MVISHTHKWKNLTLIETVKNYYNKNARRLPLSKSYKFTLISEMSFTKKSFMKTLFKQYHLLYKEEANRATIKTIPIEKRTTMYSRKEMKLGLNMVFEDMIPQIWFFYYFSL